MPVPCPIDTLDLDFRNLSVVSKNEETVNEIVVNVEKNCKIIINDSINEKNKSCIVKNIKKAEDIKKKKLLKVKAESLIKLLRSDEDRENKFVVSKSRENKYKLYLKDFSKILISGMNFSPKRVLKSFQFYFPHLKRGTVLFLKTKKHGPSLLLTICQKTITWNWLLWTDILD